MSSNNRMTKRLVRVVFSLIFVLLSGYSTANAGTTAADLLNWDDKAQISFFQITISMLGTVADLPQEGGPPVKLEIDGYDRPVVATGA